MGTDICIRCWNGGYWFVHQDSGKQVQRLLMYIIKGLHFDKMVKRLMAAPYEWNSGRKISKDKVNLRVMIVFVGTLKS